KRTPLTNPSTSVWKLTPTSMAAPSLADALPGVVFALQMPHGHVRGVTVTAIPAPGVSRFPLSSTARVRSVAEPGAAGVQLYVQFDVPVAGCHVEPPSTDTSTPATTPPPASLAGPVTATVVPCCTELPPAGAPIDELGGI